MSIQAVAWVLDHSESKGFARLVLIALANHADDAGICWPAQRTIAREAGTSIGSVPDQIAKLGLLGEVEIAEAGGPRRSTRYRLPFADLRSGDEHKERSPDERSARPGLSAARAPGVSRTITNHQESSSSDAGNDWRPEVEAEPEVAQSAIEKARQAVAHGRSLNAQA